MFTLHIQTPGRKEVVISKDKGGPAVYITGLYGDLPTSRADLLALAAAFKAAATMLDKEDQ